jgi:hypothetical protein
MTSELTIFLNYIKENARMRNEVHIDEENGIATYRAFTPLDKIIVPNRFEYVEKLSKPPEIEFYRFDAGNYTLLYITHHLILTKFQNKELFLNTVNDLKNFGEILSSFEEGDEENEHRGKKICGSN